MHIPDNYLSPASCAVLAVAAAPVVGLSITKVKAQLKENKELAPMLGIAASLSFLLMMFNVPIPGGTTAHAVGGVLLSILIGPYAASLALTVALLLQALLFGDGGILALGANIFNMAIAMPFVGYAVYHFFRKQNHETAGVLVGSYVGINVAAFLTAIELGIQPIIATQGGEPLYNPYGLAVTIPAMMVTHLTIAGAVEVFFTYVIYRFVKQVAPQELYTPTSVNTTSFVKKIRYVLIALVVLSPLGLLAEGTAFGEWSADELAEMMNNVPAGIENGFSFEALFSDYTIPGTNIAVGYILSAITALLIFYILGKMIRTMNGAKASHA
ncbi:MAG: cobalt transporter CbiM [Streptococcus sp.]|nr:cobalt transporter CbiM [Streptococcus sp.]